jgi:hypothetical protein
VRDTGCEGAHRPQTIRVAKLVERGESLQALVVGPRSRIAQLVAHGVEVVDERRHLIGALHGQAAREVPGADASRLLGDLGEGSRHDPGGQHHGKEGGERGDPGRGDQLFADLDPEDVGPLHERPRELECRGPFTGTEQRKVNVDGALAVLACSDPRQRLAVADRADEIGARSRR